MTATALADAAVQPVTTAERMDVLDVLRGVAVYGILLYNVLALSGFEFIAPAEQQALPLAGANRTAAFLIEVLVAGKFYSLFSFLFGVGFSVFIARASARGADAIHLFKRRLVGLMLIALVHTVFIWMGDILLTYAILGFALIPFVRRDDRTVLRWALFWLAAPIPLYLALLGLAQLAPAPSPGDAPMPAILARAVDAFAQGTYLEVVRANLIFTGAGFVRRLVLMFFPRVFGMFLLGFYAGRRAIFASVRDHLTLLRRVFAWGLDRLHRAADAREPMVALARRLRPGRVAVADDHLWTHSALTASDSKC